MKNGTENFDAYVKEMTRGGAILQMPQKPMQEPFCMLVKHLRLKNKVLYDILHVILRSLQMEKGEI